MAVVPRASIFRTFMILLFSFVFLIYCFYGVLLKQRTVTSKLTILPFEDDAKKPKSVLPTESSEDKHNAESQDVSSIQSSQPPTHSITAQVDTDKGGTWPAMRIVQSPELSITDALRTSLTCTATVGHDNLARYDMRWTGMDLEHSLWIEQLHVAKEGDNIERKIFFRPWLDSLAGEYTCQLFMKNHPHATVYNKTYMISGNYRGLINSRSYTEKFKSSTPSKWFTNANLCGGDSIWQDYAELHASILSGNEKRKYLTYQCTHKTCGGYGNRISGITVLLIYAMLTRRALLINMTIPVNINSYFLPNAVEWNHVVPTGLKTEHVNLINSKNFLPFYKTFESVVFDDQYDIVNVQINFGMFYFLTKMSNDLLHRMITMLSLRTHYDLVLLYGCAFNYLFKYQPKTVQAIDTLQSELGLETGKFIALHVRSRIGDRYQPFHLKYEPMFECAAMAARTLSQKLGIPKVPIFLAADHPNVTNYAVQHYKDSIVLSKAPLFHIDFTKYTGNNATDQYDNAMIGILSDIEICSRAGMLVRSLSSTMSEVMGAIHFLSPQDHLHPFYFYNNLSVCQP